MSFRTISNPCPEAIGARASVKVSARAIALYYLELHVWSKICVFEIQSFLLLKYVKYLI